MITLPAGAFSRKEQPLMQERLDKTVKHIFAIIAVHLITKEDVYFPFFYVAEEEIEKSLTKRRKTMRILGEAGLLKKCKDISITDSSSTRLMWDFEESFLQHSKEYAEKEIFPEEPKEVTEYLSSTNISQGFSLESDKDESIYTTGYKDLDNFSRKGKIYLYWNQSEYVKGTTDIGPFRFYPKELLINREKAIMKAVLRKYSESSFADFLKKNFGSTYKDQDDSIKWDDEFYIHMRNFARHPIALMQFARTFTSPKGYIKEYKTVVERITFEYNRLRSLKEKIDAFGGTKVVFATYIKECLADIINKAPLLINGDIQDKESLQFILDNRDNFTYEYLFT